MSSNIFKPKQNSKSDSNTNLEKYQEKNTNQFMPEAVEVET